MEIKEEKQFCNQRKNRGRKIMGSRRIFLSLLLFISVFSVLERTTIAIRKSYIVYLGAHSHSFEARLVDFHNAKDAHYEFLGTFLGSKEKASKAIFYSYNKHINGFAAFLEEDEAKRLKIHPNVVSVFENKARKLHTTLSWNFLGLEQTGYGSSLWKKAAYGDDVIIGSLDTGVWPESKSFRDDGLGPVPAKWKGFCQNNTAAGVPCNRKLIGARYFDKGYKAMLADIYKQDPPPASARDIDGHGTHTLSIAAGRFVPGASAFGFGNGTAKGGSPSARVATYKVCWPPVEEGTECTDADILAAFDAAIHDGVDILSVSIDGTSGGDYWNDATAIGAFHAVKNGILVVCSAGNDGPKDATVNNVAPWILTVGANTIDRSFTNYVELGNGKRYKGASLSSDALPKSLYSMSSAAKVKAADAEPMDALCCLKGTLDPEKVKGKIIACLDGTNGRVEKGKVVMDAGGIGMIIANGEGYGDEIPAEAHLLPASHLTESDGLELFDYANHFPNPMAYITSVVTETNVKPAPVMASFSSRGPNTITPEILKPDVTAPGVSILAAYSQVGIPTALATDPRRVLFNFVSGTSMSAPHAAGIAGLLKQLHPDWSPSAIKSAIMTTARTRDNMNQTVRDWTNTQANPFIYGAGSVRVARAMDPGLIYDLTMHDYLNFLCAKGYNQTLLRYFVKREYRCPETFDILHFNYPAITVPNLYDRANLTRLLKNVGSPGTYTVEVEEPIGISVSVEPKTLTFKQVGEKKMFWMHLKLKEGEVHSYKNYVFGKLKWSDGVHDVRSPISVKVSLHGHRVSHQSD